MLITRAILLILELPIEYNRNVSLMRHIKKIAYFSLILSTCTVTTAYSGSTLFTITPSITNLNISSNGNSSVVYTITNNSTANATPSITAAYQSTGNNLTIASNNCNTSLSPYSSCTFRVLISGANQPDKFTITPRVCGFNGFICSIPSTAVTVTVTKPAAGLPTRAYEEVANHPSVTRLIGININNTSDVISSHFLDSSSNVNSVVTSPDGSKLYATIINEVAESIAYYNVTSDNLILNQIFIISESFLSDSSTDSMQTAITPDGSTLFITRYSNGEVAPGASFYKMDLNADAPTITAIDDPDNILASPRGLVVSSDSQTVYIGTDTDYIVAMPVNALSVHADNKIAEGNIPVDDHLSLAIDPAGNTLYVGNYSEGSVSILSVTGTQGQFEETILTDGSFTGASGLAVSPDGATLYVAEIDDNSVLSVPLNNTGSVLVQSEITGAFGLALSPNGSLLYVTQASGFSYTTTVINTANFFASPSTIDIDGVSLTIGQFIGP